MLSCIEPPPDDGIKVPPSNSKPELVITSHLDGEALFEGYPVTFQGTASDVDHTVSDLVVTWYVGTEIACPAAQPDPEGLSACDIVLEVGDTEVSGEVTDAGGAKGSALVALTVMETEAPVPTIESPVSDVAYYIDHEVWISGQVSDSEDAVEDLVYSWTSDLDGDLDLGSEPDANGAMEGQIFLTEGNHVITLWVEDLVGKSATAEVEITVRPENTAPSCSITAPNTGSASEEDELIQFRALISDPDVLTDKLTVEWMSDVDGTLGSSIPFPAAEASLTFPYSDLTVSTHAIAILVHDEVGAACTDSIIYTIGSPPQITIASPLDGDLFAHGDEITFSATVDPGEGSLTNMTMDWTSDLSGQLHVDPPDATTGASSFARSDLVAGNHVLTITATSDLGFYDQRTVVFEVNTRPTPPTVSISPDPALTTDALVVNIDTPSYDAEGLTPTYTYAWTVDGTATAHATDLLPAAETTRDEVWEVTVTPSDGTFDGPPGTASLTISNTPPVLAAMAMTPTTNVTEATTFTCLTGTTSDADGDTVATTLSWSVSGVDPGVTTDTLDGTWFSKNDVVACIGTPNDGTDDGTAVTSSSVTVANTAPQISTVNITPSTAYAADILTCAWSGFTDVDSDTDLSTVSWTINGTPAGSDPTLSGGFTYSDLVRCDVTPFDGTDSGTTLHTQISIANTAPILADASLGPDPAYEGDTLLCSPGSTTDADGTTNFSYLHSWEVAGSTVNVSTATGSLGSNHWNKHEAVTCTVTPRDGTDSGDSVVSNTVTVSNSAPVVASVSLLPLVPTADDDLTCTAGSGSDVDPGDSVTFSYAWTVAGSVVTAETTDTLTSASFAKGEDVLCTVTPSDGEADGSGVDSNTVTVGNSAPSVSGVSITSDETDSSVAYAGSTLTCSWTDFTDSDANDTDQSEVTWYVGGTSVGTGTTLAGAFAHPQQVRCTVAPYDGETYGSTVSVDLNITNSAPVVASASLTPLTAHEGDEFTCTAGTVSDADNTTAFTTTYRWDVSGVDPGVSNSTDTLRSNNFNRSDSVTCYITVNDGFDDSAEAASNTVNVLNTAPILAPGSVSVSPDPPSSEDDLTCAHSPATDADPGDNGNLTYSYAWVADGSASPITSQVFSSTNTTKGGSYTCSATPSDGLDSGATVAASNIVTVNNTTPSIGAVTLTPSTAYATTTLTCGYGGYSDADGDSDQSTYNWTVDGVSKGTGTLSSTTPITSTLSGVFVHNNNVTCTVTANDGQAQGNSISESVTILNSAPTLVQVRLNPTQIFETTTVSCLAQQISDADGTTTFNYTYAWYRDAANLNVTSSTLTGVYFSKGDDLQCALTASDGTDSSNTVLSTPVITVKNSKPSISAVTVTPSPVAETENLLCIASGWSDADGDLDQTAYEWTITDSTGSSSYGEGDDPGTGGRILYSTDTVEDDIVTCTVTPNDGQENGTALSDFSQVGNDRPSAPTLSVSPTSPTGGVDDLVCQITLPSSDPDGDTINYTFTWTVDGVEFTGTSTTTYTDDTVPGSATTAGENWTCSVVANDGLLDALYTSDDTVNVQ